MTGSDKQKIYESLYRQIESVIEGEDDAIANMANASSLIHEAFGFWWTGFYIVNDGVLVLGPFQGPVACTRIPYGKGVCGTAWERQATVVVPYVHLFPGHIACSSLSRSEIVVPIFDGTTVKAVLDIDSKELATFDETDSHWLERITGLL